MQDPFNKLVRTAARLLPIAALALASLSAAHAATLAVPAGYPTIQAAVNAAQNGDTVLIADGTYGGPGNRDIDLGGKSLTITSQNGAAKTVIDCGGSLSTDGSGNHRGFYIHSGEPNVTISGLTVKNGYETYISSIPNSGSGGGIYHQADNNTNGISDGGVLTLTGCTITGNTAGGGGIYNVFCTLIMTGCTITGNNASGGSGGGILNEGPGTVRDKAYIGTTTLTNCTISGNSASSGGGIANFNGQAVYSSTITLTGCTIAANTAQQSGGGIFNVNGDSASAITLTRCTISGNSAGGGGGFSCSDQSGGTTTLTNCAIAGNTALKDSRGYGGDGGGVSIIASNHSVTVTLTSCTLTGNNAQDNGGGGDIENYNAGAFTLTNCTISGNTASLRGGGVYGVNQGSIGRGDTLTPAGTFTLTNCTLAGNSAPQAGGIFTGPTFSGANGPITLTNDILYGDTGGEVANTSNRLTNVATTSSDIQGGYSGSGNLNADPLFVNASNDLHLQPGSPCLGAGTSAGAPATDADSKLRPSPPSIGAYEGSPAAQAITTHLLWTNPDTKAMVWNVTAAGQYIIAGTYGPYTDGSPSNVWTATALATGPDGLSRLLWNNTDGRVVLWTVNSDGTFTITGVYGPYTDAPNSPNSVWKATALSVGPDNVPHILWTNPDGKALYWNVKSDGTFAIVGAYGPYTDGPDTANWAATALVTGPDGISHLLWNNPDGHVALWTLDGQGGFTPFFYGPYNDGAPNTPWTATAASVGADNVPHLLWTNPDGKALMWNVKPDGTFTIPGVYGPYMENGSLWGATSLVTGAGGLSHLLWNNPDGRVALWTINSDGTFTVVGGYGPYTDGSPGTPWSAIAVSASP